MSFESIKVHWIIFLLKEMNYFRLILKSILNLNMKFCVYNKNFFVELN